MFFKGLKYRFILQIPCCPSQYCGPLLFAVGESVIRMERREIHLAHCNSIAAFNLPKLVPWKLQTTWGNSMRPTHCTRFTVSHIYCEGNSCIDGLANHSLTIQDFRWWDFVWCFVRCSFYTGRIGLPSFRFSHF